MKIYVPILTPRTAALCCSVHNVLGGPHGMCTCNTISVNMLRKNLQSGSWIDVKRKKKTCNKRYLDGAIGRAGVKAPRGPVDAGDQCRVSHVSLGRGFQRAVPHGEGMQLAGDVPRPHLTVTVAHAQQVRAELRTKHKSSIQFNRSGSNQDGKKKKHIRVAACFHIPGFSSSSSQSCGRVRPLCGPYSRRWCTCRQQQGTWCFRGNGGSLPTVEQLQATTKSKRNSINKCHAVHEQGMGKDWECSGSGVIDG